ncbi:MAG TPA: hypothetical protein VGA52_08710 [Anaerolineales bacterium]|jgi:hypothetical protein
MQRKRQIRGVGLALIAVGVGALGIALGVVFYQVNPNAFPTAVPPTATFGPPPTLAQVSQWLVTFEHRFEVAQYAVGNHRYRLEVSCGPAGGSAVYDGGFAVTGAAEQYRSRAYLRPNGVWTAPRGGQEISSVHPDQSLGAAVTLIYPTLDDAEAARTACVVSASLDGNLAVAMDPAIPVESDSGG